MQVGGEAAYVRDVYAAHSLVAEGMNPSIGTSSEPFPARGVTKRRIHEMEALLIEGSIGVEGVDVHVGVEPFTKELDVEDEAWPVRKNVAAARFTLSIRVARAMDEICPAFHGTAEGWCRGRSIRRPVRSPWRRARRQRRD